MGLFGLGRKREVLDLSERYKSQKEKLAKIKEQTKVENEAPANMFGFFGGSSSVSNVSRQEPVNIENSSIDPAERRKRLANRLKNMTDQIENLSNQVYHLQQKVEVLERKNK